MPPTAVAPRRPTTNGSELFAADLEAVGIVFETYVPDDRDGWVYVRTISKGMNVGNLRDDWNFRIWDVSSTGEDPSISCSIEFRGRDEE